METPLAQPPRRLGLRTMDSVVLLVTLVTAVGFHLNFRGSAAPHVALSGDPANIASFAAGTDHPELFQGDALLGNPANFRYYGSIQVDMLQWLKPHYGDYGLANDAFLGVHLWLYLFGWYVFGAVFWRNRWCGVAWAVLNAAQILMNVGEVWGPLPDVIPRVLFQSYLPWLLVFALVVAPRSARSWPLLMFLAGALVWVHPVSAPAWVAALWFGLAVTPVPSLSRAQRLGWLAAAAIAALLPVWPFARLYFGEQPPLSPSEAAAALTFLQARFSRANYDVIYGLAGFAWWMARTGLLPAAVAGLWLASREALPFSEPERARRRVALAWLAGVLVCSVLLPALDQLQARLRETMPAQTDLIRGLRYLIPFMYGAWLWPLERWCRRTDDAAVRQRRIAVTAALVLLWTVTHRPLCLGRNVGELPALKEAIVAVRTQVPVRGRMLAMGVSGLPIRYAALRPVVFDFKDGSSLGLVNPLELRAWHDAYQRYEQISQLTDQPQRLTEAVALARQLGAQYLLMREYPPETAAETGVRVLFSNAEYRLYALYPDLAK